MFITATFTAEPIPSLRFTGLSVETGGSLRFRRRFGSGLLPGGRHDHRFLPSSSRCSRYRWLCSVCCRASVCFSLTCLITFRKRIPSVFHECRRRLAGLATQSCSWSSISCEVRGGIGSSSPVCRRCCSFSDPSKARNRPATETKAWSMCVISSRTERWISSPVGGFVRFSGGRTPAL